MRWLALAALFLLLFAAFIGAWIAAFLITSHYGFNNQVTPIYAFVSGVGPMFLAALGYTALVGGMWHMVNCHEPGCVNIGRHRVNGTPWCNAHHESARLVKTTDELLAEIVELLKTR